MTTPLCVAHHDQPTQPAPGLAVCAHHRNRIEYDLRTLPAIHRRLLLPRPPRPGQARGNGEHPAPIDGARIEARIAIKALLVSWALTLFEAGRVTPPPDEPAQQIEWCTRAVVLQLDWLLAGEHADQLAHDMASIPGWRRLSEPESARQTIACHITGCPGRVTIDETDIMRCRACADRGIDTWGVLSWWIEQAPTADGPLTLHGLRDWLLIQGYDIPAATLRTLADRDKLTEVDRDTRGRRMYDPLGCLVVVAALRSRSA